MMSDDFLICGVVMILNFAWTICLVELIIGIVTNSISTSKVLAS